MEKKLLAIVTDDRFNNYDEEKSIFTPLNIDLQIFQCNNTKELINACADADAVLVNLANVNADVISAMKKCKVISRYGVGLDNIDTAECMRRGIKVANVKDYCGPEISEHAISLLLSVLRGTNTRDRDIRTRLWNMPSKQRVIYGSTVGIAGFGFSGKAFAKRISAFEPKEILVWTRSKDNYINQIKHSPIRYVSFDELLANSDYLSLHLSLNSETIGIFNESAFSKMKPSAVIINTARGGLVDSDTLTQALINGNIYGAGIDVFDTEPLPKNHPLLSAPNIILSDHTAYRSDRSVSELKLRCAENAAKVLRPVTFLKSNN